MQKKKNHFVGFMHFFCFSFPLTILQFLKALNNKKRREKGKGKGKKKSNLVEIHREQFHWYPVKCFILSTWDMHISFLISSALFTKRIEEGEKINKLYMQGDLRTSIPKPTIASESPTSIISTPACSATDAEGKSCAVTMVMGTPDS